MQLQSLTRSRSGVDHQWGLTLRWPQCIHLSHLRSILTHSKNWADSNKTVTYSIINYKKLMNNLSNGKKISRKLDNQNLNNYILCLLESQLLMPTTFIFRTIIAIITIQFKHLRLSFLRVLSLRRSLQLWILMCSLHSPEGHPERHLQLSRVLEGEVKGVVAEEDKQLPFLIKNCLHCNSKKNIGLKLVLELPGRLNAQRTPRSLKIEEM